MAQSLKELHERAQIALQAVQQLRESCYEYPRRPDFDAFVFGRVVAVASIVDQALRDAELCIRANMMSEEARADVLKQATRKP